MTFYRAAASILFLSILACDGRFDAMPTDAQTAWDKSQPKN
jgi:hypothetical protein